MKKFIIAIALTAAAASSHAQMYVQGNLGAVTAKSGNSSDTKSSLGVAFGYQINQNFAVDAIYQSLYKDSSNDQSSNALFVRAIGIYPITDTLSINAKIGAGQTKSKAGADSAKGNMTFGIGIDYAINKQTSVGFDIDSYKTKETSALSDVNFTNASLTIKYKF